MGRQSARLWHNGKDHKDLWKLIDYENNFRGKTWRMHWRIYKGNKLLWEKLPPKFFAWCKTSGTVGDFRYYGSDFGKIFTNYGFCIDCRSNTQAIMQKFCKVGEYAFSISNLEVLYTTNFYSWKALKTISNYSASERILHIGNYNDRLYVITENKIILYDIKNEKIQYLSNNQYSFLNSEVYAFGNALLVICSKIVNAYHSDQYLLVFKNDALAKTFSDVSGEYYLWAKSLTGNGKTAYLIGNNFAFQGYGNRISILSSNDGLTWVDEFTNPPYYSLDHLFYANGNLYNYVANASGQKINYLYKLENNALINVENKVKAGTLLVPQSGISYVGTKEKVLAFEANGYMYANAFVTEGEEEKYCFVRFKDFESEECEVLSEQAILDGIYAGG